MKQQRKILIVEDHPDLRDLLTLFLTHRKFEILTAKNGIEAIEIASSQVPDLIIMDIFLPLMSGLDAASELRRNALTRGVPILAISARAFRGHRELLEQNFDDYLQKPVSLEQLESTIEKLLQKSELVRKSRRILTLGEFMSRLRESGLEISEKTLWRSYKGLNLLRTQNDLPWEEIRAKVETLVRELKQTSREKTFKLRAARLPLTRRDWERY